MPDFVSTKFIVECWPRPNQGHLAAQDIPELGNFIQAGFADECPNRGDSGIFLNLENRLLCLAGVAVHLTCNELCYIILMNLGIAVGPHGSKFQNSEWLATLSQTLLLE